MESSVSKNQLARLVASSRLKRIVLWAVGTSVLIFMLDLSVIGAFSLVRPDASRVDAVIVLGAKVGTPALTERTLQGLKYYKEGKTDTIVLSGGRGSGESMSEAAAMQKVLESQVAKTGGHMPNVILESESADTFQNIHNSKGLISNAKSVMVVSDCFHLARSAILAKRDGFNNVYWDAPAPSYYPLKDLGRYYLRETIAMVMYIPKLIAN